MDDYIVSYAQNREDVILSGFFPNIKKGFYVDVGANHPDLLSVTKFFYDRGWNGINIEPNAQLYKLIQQQRSRDINLNMGAADKSGELVLREYPGGDGLSTFSKEAQDQYQKASSVYRRNTGQYKDYEVTVKPLKEVFEEHAAGKTINFMNIDVEGFEYNVIKGNDWNKYRPQVICIEANHILHDWRPLLQAARYELVFFDGLNNYYVAQEHHELAEKFSYVNTLLLGPPILAAGFSEKLNRSATLSDRAQDKLARQILIEQNLREEINRLHGHIAASGRLRSLLKQIIAAFNRIALIQIEKLNKPKIKTPPPLSYKEDIELSGLLLKVKQYDLIQYYNAKTSAPLSYRIIHGSYAALFGTMKSAARKTIKVLRARK